MTNPDPIRVNMVRLYNPTLMAAPLYCPQAEALPNALNVCLSAGMSLVQSDKLEEANACYAAMIGLLHRDPNDWFTLARDLQNIGFHISLPLPCVFLDLVFAEDDTPDEVAP